MSNEQKPGDPADKAADGAFGGVHSHRAGYGDDKLARLVDYLRQRPSATLASGEGALLLAEIDRLRAAAKDSADHYADARAEIDRLRNELKTETETVQHLISERTADREHWGAIEDSLNRAERILAALREPSNAVVLAADKKIPILYRLRDTKAGIIAAVTAAEQEVGG